MFSHGYSNSSMLLSTMSRVSLANTVNCPEQLTFTIMLFNRGSPASAECFSQYFYYFEFYPNSISSLACVATSNIGNDSTHSSAFGPMLETFRIKFFYTVYVMFGIQNLICLLLSDLCVRSTNARSLGRVFIGSFNFFLIVSSFREFYRDQNHVDLNQYV